MNRTIDTENYKVEYGEYGEVIVYRSAKDRFGNQYFTPVTTNPSQLVYALQEMAKLVGSSEVPLEE